MARPTTPTLTPEEQAAAAQQRALDAAGAEYRDLLEAKARTEARITELQTFFREQFDLGNHLAGPVKVSIQRNVRRDDAAFMAAYPFEQYPDFYKPSIDTATIKHELAPAALEAFQVYGTEKVIVTPLESA